MDFPGIVPQEDITHEELCNPFESLKHNKEEDC